MQAKESWQSIKLFRLDWHIMYEFFKSSNHYRMKCNPDMAIQEGGELDFLLKVKTFLKSFLCIFTNQINNSIQNTTTQEWNKK